MAKKFLVAVNARYLSQVQWGIQATHVLTQMIEYADQYPEIIEIIREYSQPKGHTIVILDGGTSDAMLGEYLSYLPEDFAGDEGNQAYLATLEDQEKIPMAIFREPNIQNAVTAFGAIVDDDWRQDISTLITNEMVFMTDAERLVSYFNKLPLAR